MQPFLLVSPSTAHMWCIDTNVGKTPIHVKVRISLWRNFQKGISMYWWKLLIPTIENTPLLLLCGIQKVVYIFYKRFNVFNYVYVHVFAYEGSVCQWVLVLMRARRGPWIMRSCTYRQLWAIWHRSSAGMESALNRKLGL